MKLTDEAIGRIDISENITEKIRQLSGSIDEEWHVFTFKQDKKKTDPKRFRVFKTRGGMPTKHVMDISFKDKKILITLKRKLNLNIDLYSMEAFHELLPKSAQKDFSTLKVEEKIGLLNKISRR